MKLSYENKIQLIKHVRNVYGLSLELEAKYNKLDENMLQYRRIERAILELPENAGQNDHLKAIQELKDKAEYLEDDVIYLENHPEELL